ncbi:molybdate ABC transporter substrate-binding protein [Agaribacterium haliotis]|uniref:molybdate ABC transporter substrate-binding protein n=1 Tax=Agaribacterium haliotis TaxID=2013869 RepID=UPI00130451A7|nr:molybdate ABC transporter substrate-binding protein [Agaribacterium haliotis]
MVFIRAHAISWLTGLARSVSTYVSSYISQRASTIVSLFVFSILSTTSLAKDNDQQNNTNNNGPLTNGSDFNIAVASNFKACYEKLAEAYSQQHNLAPQQIKASYASSGQLAAMISRGAPFAIFLSADQKRAQQLIQRDLADAQNGFIYAVGQLVLWAPKLEQKPGPAWLKEHGTHAIKRLSLANPKHAPYGLAAEQSLKQLGLYGELQDKLVFGQNVAQSLQFVASGAADMGFIAYAQWLELDSEQRGQYWLVPADLHSAIQQQAIEIKAWANNTSNDFFRFLKQKQAQQIVRNCGYLSDIY